MVRCRGVGSLILQSHLLRLTAHFSQVDAICLIMAICAMSRVLSLRGAGTQRWRKFKKWTLTCEQQPFCLEGDTIWSCKETVFWRVSHGLVLLQKWWTDAGFWVSQHFDLFQQLLLDYHLQRVRDHFASLIFSRLLGMLPILRNANSPTNENILWIHVVYGTYLIKNVG